MSTKAEAVRLRPNYHGLTGSLAHKSWSGMLQRCYNKNNEKYVNYGNRGIGVCPEWRDFKHFVSDMGLPPGPKYSIDRIDNNGNYTKENCKWSTYIQQARNRRSTKCVTYKNKTKPLVIWSEELNIPYHTLFARLKLKWSIEKAFTTPVRMHGSRTLNKQKQTERNYMNNKYYKHQKYGTTYGNPIVTPTGRCAWPALVKPQDAPPAKPGEPQGAPRYGITIILNKSDATVITWIKAVSSMIKEMLVVFNENRKAKLSLDSVLIDGDGFDLEKYPYYKDSWILTARNVKLPNIVDGKKSEIPADAIMGGMFVRATVTPLLTGHGVSYKLEALQRVRDDSTRFAGASRAGGYLDMIPVVADEGENTSTSDETPVAAEAATDAPKNGKAKALAML